MKYCLIQFFILVSMKLIAQPEKYFEGVITYESIYESSSDQVDAKALARELGTSTKFYFKEGNYFQTSDDAEEVSMNLRSVKDQRYYFGEKNNDTIRYVNFSTENETLVDQSLDDSIVYKIAGFDCKKFQLKAKRIGGSNIMTRDYYYTPQLAINPEWFANTNNTHEYIKFQNIKSLPLKIVIDYGVLKVTLTAIKIEHKKIETKIFELPPNAILVEEK